MIEGCIAVATDFSARADRAVDRALQISQEQGCKLCVLHALETPGQDRSSLDRKMQASVGQPEDHDTLEFVYIEGSVPKAITKACEDREVGLLAVGPARYNSLGDYFLGTAVDYVLRNTRKPVLVVKNRTRSPYCRIVAGTDFSPGSTRAIVAAARLFSDAAMHVVHAWHVPFEGWNKDAYVADEVVEGERKDMRAFLQQLADREPRLAQATNELVRGNAAHAIAQGVDGDPDTLVVLGSHGTSGWRQAAIGSVTSDLLRTLDADMLVVNAKDAGEG